MMYDSALTWIVKQCTCTQSDSSCGNFSAGPPRRTQSPLAACQLHGTAPKPCTSSSVVPSSPSAGCCSPIPPASPKQATTSPSPWPTSPSSSSATATAPSTASTTSAATAHTPSCRTAREPPQSSPANTTDGPTVSRGTSPKRPASKRSPTLINPSTPSSLSMFTSTTLASSG